MRCLTEEAQDRIDSFNWRSRDEGCTCFLGAAPCGWCTDENNPHSVLEEDESWIVAQLPVKSINEALLQARQYEDGKDRDEVLQEREAEIQPSLEVSDAEQARRQRIYRKGEAASLRKDGA